MACQLALVTFRFKPVQRKFKDRVFLFAGWCQWCFGFIVAIFAALLKANPNEAPLLFAGAISKVHAYAWIMIPLATLAMALAKLVRQTIGPPRIWAAIHSLLSDFRNHVFEQHDGPLHYHRATLFKHVGWRWSLTSWPHAGWLKAVERSGHTTRKKVVIFKAPDNADDAEGVAGQTWARNGTIIRRNLPELGDEPSDRAIGEYGEKSWVSTEWIRKNKPQARSLLGIPVEVKGKLWGVLVLDSRDPVGVPNEIPKHYRLVARVLGKLLEGV